MPLRFTSHHARALGVGALVAAALAGCAPHGNAADPPPATAPVAGQAAAAAPTDAAPAKANAVPTNTPPARAASADAELSAALPAGARLALAARGDLDGDGDEDAVAAYAPASAPDDAPRSLLVLLRDAGGALRASASGPTAVLCRACGGMMGDPLQAIGIDRDGFTLRFEGGSREQWSSDYRFAHAGATGGWRLAAIVFGGFDRADGNTAQRRQGPADFGDVPLATFDPRAFPADALP